MGRGNEATTSPGERGEGDVQGTNAKHQPDADLLLPFLVQSVQLRERDGQHPYIHRNRDGRIAPYDGVGVQTNSLVLVVPPRPEEVDRDALERGGERECEAVQRVEDDGPPQDPPDRQRREDTEEEVQQRHLEQRHLDEVQQLQDVEVHAEPGDVVERHRPDIVAQAVGRYTVYFENGTRDTHKQAGRDPPVVSGDAETTPDLEDNSDAAQSR